MSKVVDSTEKDKRVFKKPQENREEEKYFYNENYFKDIGFPETKVFEGVMTEDGVMRGGYYNHPEQLTDPFRRFVNIIQKEKQLNYDSSDSSEVEDETYLTPISSVEDVPKNETPGFFDRITEYGNYIKTSTDKLSPYFKINRVEVEKLENETQPQTKPMESETVNKKYWVVKIPILKDAEFTPKGKYEKAETKMNQILREEKVDKKLGKSKIGNIYDVGSKYVRICEGVKEWERYKIDDIKLPGSKMSKMLIIRI